MSHPGAAKRSAQGALRGCGKASSVALGASLAYDRPGGLAMLGIGSIFAGLALGSALAGLVSPKAAKMASVAVALSAAVGSWSAFKQISSIDWGWWSWVAVAIGGIWALLWFAIGLAIAVGLWFYGSMMAARRMEQGQDAQRKIKDASGAAGRRADGEGGL